MTLRLLIGMLLLNCGTALLAAELRLYTEDYRPMSFIDKGELTGMAVEVVELLVQRTGQETRIELVPWTRGYQQVQHARRGSGLKVRTLQEVERLQSVAVPKQWYSYEYLSDRGLKNLYGVPTPQQMTKMFKHGRVALLVANNLTLDEMLAEQGMRREEVELQFTFMDNSAYIAFSKNTDPQLVQRWQHALEQATRDGSLQRIQRRWFSEPYKVPGIAPTP